MTPSRPEVRGVDLDAETRCAHYRTELDIVALKLRCCRTYYACRQCHDELTTHIPEVWPIAERDQKAILCGACGMEMGIGEYLACADQCPSCKSRFNPGCASHHHLYFETA